MCMPCACRVHLHLHVRTRCAALDLGLSGTVDGWSATGRTWVLDPIDGTKGFLRGDQYAICLTAHAHALRMHTAHAPHSTCPLHTAHCTLHTAHCTLHTAHAHTHCNYSLHIHTAHDMFMRVHRYAICLSLLDGGRPVVGLLGCPNLSPTDARASAATGCAAGGTLAWAVRGGGAFACAALQEPQLPQADAPARDRRPTRVSAAVAPARVGRCEAFEAGHSSRGKAAAAAAALGLTAEPVRMDGQG